CGGRILQRPTGLELIKCKFPIPRKLKGMHATHTERNDQIHFKRNSAFVGLTIAFVLIFVLFPIVPATVNGAMGGCPKSSRCAGIIIMIPFHSFVSLSYSAFGFGLVYAPNLLQSP